MKYQKHKANIKNCKREISAIFASSILTLKGKRE